MIGNGKIFVSHTHADNARCEPLLTALDAWRQDYWFDAQQLDAGQQLTPRLQEAILQRDVLLRVCTVNSANSYWMNLERSAFRTAQYQQGKSNPRVCLDLVFDVDYTPGALERADATIVAVNKPQHIWLAELAARLGVKQREARGRVSRRSVVGLGGAAIVTLASLGAGGVIAKARLDAANAPYPTPHTIPFTNPQTLDPHIKWYFKAGSDSGVGAAMAATQDALYIGTGEGVYALDARDGGVIWARTDVQGDGSTSLAVVGDTVYATQLGLTGSLTALNAATGVTRWTTQIASTLSDTLFARLGDAVYMVTDDNSLISYSLRDGSVRWRSSAKIANTGTPDRAPVADANGVYVGGDDGVLSAFSPLDGSLLWTYRTDFGENGGTSIGIGYTAALANGVVYFGSKNNYLYALNAADGSLRWRYATTVASVGVEPQYTPAVAGGAVYIGLTANILALNADTGAVLWNTPVDPSDKAEDFVSGSLAVDGDVIYVPFGSHLYAFSAKKQAPLWNILTRPNDSNERPPIISGTTVYWSGANSFIYALDATVGG